MKVAFPWPRLLCHPRALHNLLKFEGLCASGIFRTGESGGWEVVVAELSASLSSATINETALIGEGLSQLPSLTPTARFCFGGFTARLSGVAVAAVR